MKTIIIAVILLVMPGCGSSKDVKYITSKWDSESDSSYIDLSKVDLRVESGSGKAKIGLASGEVCGCDFYFYDVKENWRTGTYVINSCGFESGVNSGGCNQLGVNGAFQKSSKRLVLCGGSCETYR